MVSTTACNFLALRHLRLDQTVSVAFLAPLIVALLAGPFLGEWVGWRRLVAIFVGFIGVLIVVHPGIGGLHPAFAFAFGGMLAYAFFMLLTRYLAAYDAPLVMLFYSILLGTFALAPFAIWQWVWPQTLSEWLLLLCLGVLGGTGHYLFIHAYRLAPASSVAPFLYMQILTMVAFGFAVFGDVPDVWTLVGAGGRSSPPASTFCTASAACAKRWRPPTRCSPSRPSARRRGGRASSRPTPRSGPRRWPRAWPPSAPGRRPC